MILLSILIQWGRFRGKENMIKGEKYKKKKITLTSSKDNQDDFLHVKAILYLSYILSITPEK